MELAIWVVAKDFKLYLSKRNLIWIDKDRFIKSILTFMSLEDISEHQFAFHLGFFEIRLLLVVDTSPIGTVYVIQRMYLV